MLRRLLPVLMLCTASVPVPTMAQQAASSPPAAEAPQAVGPVGIELNRLEAQGPACRVWLLLKNPAAEPVETLRLDLLIFGKDGVIGRRLAVDVGPLPAQKTMARIFDLSAQSCDAIGSVLLNDVLACGADAAARSACLGRIATSSRVPAVTFEK